MSGRQQVNRWRRAVLLASVGALVVSAPAAAVGSNADVTKGSFHVIAAGITQNIAVGGDAVMVRVPLGRTLVVVFASGLAPNTTYGSHVHSQACANGDADGHYKFDLSGAADSANEIWPGFTTNAQGIGIGFAQNAGIAGLTAVSVVIHAPGGAKIACADLK